MLKPLELEAPLCFCPYKASWRVKGGRCIWINLGLDS